MKMIYMGIQRIQGHKKADGAPFDMTVCYVALPIESGAFGKDQSKLTRITGHGFKPAEVPAVPEAVAKLEKIPFGALADFDIDQQFFAGEIKSVVVGVKSHGPAVKSA